MKTRKTLLAAALCAGLFSATSAHAVLILTLGDQGVYDYIPNTWLQYTSLDWYVTDGAYQPGLVLTPTGPYYWFSTDYAFQFVYDMNVTMSVWDVLPGDSYAAVTSPVPEPETYAMLLAGIGLLGFTARRRSALR